MRFNKLDLNQLVLLDALLVERSVVRAAQRVFLSQPAASNGLARLREFFADDLLVQVGKTMVLTPLAETLTEPVSDVLLRILAITRVRPTFDASTSTRKIRIVASDYVIEVLLSDVVRKIWQSAPKIQLELSVITENSREKLENGEVEILIAPEFFNAAGHPSEPLFEDTFSCLVWEGNGDVKKKLTADQYLALGHVAVQWGVNRVQTIDETFLLERGMHRRREVVAPSFTLLPRLLVGTNRIATLHTRLAHVIASGYGLRVLQCPISLPTVKETIQWHKYQQHDPAISWFKDQTVSLAKQLLK
ncbi:LysR family transcriptional regulator (plasmid) [Burkholderia gladioli pv. gladioli]|uniref:Nodulation protein D 2 n=1 Tax=Burkholderia gladioli TaxID=28095 RepID=A0AAW3EPR1_BURGA|nr:LysR family transcriptional regulator [Burkholderia gladioli]AJW93839.1 nodulation protein D 2 [Burkholderia gladioli]ASD84617.1 LysR family transcriptional regulator [Burkholderia gladioli pv. gladioli]AWY49865.1 LysR family transcriptional regulator [Burkholderia gladioli pv. gladioli]KGC09783.1 nodulation protein D 2 [Burkholderia gladioli]MDJ1167737.1 LysR family transcriptional regulator [Burkholderia gladioli pv. gladioli]